MVRDRVVLEDVKVYLKDAKDRQGKREYTAAARSYTDTAKVVREAGDSTYATELSTIAAKLHERGVTDSIIRYLKSKGGSNMPEPSKTALLSAVDKIKGKNYRAARRLLQDAESTVERFHGQDSFQYRSRLYKAT